MRVVGPDLRLLHWRRGDAHSFHGRGRASGRPVPPNGFQMKCAMKTETALGSLLLLLCATGFAVLLDLGLGDVLVLRTNHSENGGSRVLASGNRTELLRALTARLSSDAGAAAAEAQSGQHLGWAAGGAFAAERVFHCHARAIERLTFHEGAELIGEI